jgi:hypothetical protein
VTLANVARGLERDERPEGIITLVNTSWADGEVVPEVLDALITTDST